MKKVKIYAKELQMVVFVFGYALLGLFAIIATWKNNREINDAAFVVWFVMMLVWLRASCWIAGIIVKSFKIPIDKIEELYANAMKMPDGLKKYHELSDYHTAKFNQYSMKMTHSHHSGFEEMAEWKKKAEIHDNMRKDLRTKIYEEQVRHNEH